MIESILSGDFLTHLDPTRRHLIISDISISHKAKHIQCYSFADLRNKTIDPREYRDATIICIAYQLTSHDILLIDKEFLHPHHRRSCNPGLISIYRKAMPEDNDITTMLSHHYQVLEPVSISHLCSTLYGDDILYARIHDTVLPTQLEEQRRGATPTSIAIRTSKRAEFTVLAASSCIDRVASAIHTVTE